MMRTEFLIRGYPLIVLVFYKHDKFKKGDGKMKGYLSIREAAEKWGVSERRVQQYCLNGRIPGAERFANAWVIPDTATKPTDPRKDRRRKE